MAGQPEPDSPRGAALRFKPVTTSTVGDFRAVFEGPGGPKYCWCMAWRTTKVELKDTTHAARRAQILGRIEKRVPVGLVGYAGGEPVAWVSIAPKGTYERLGGPDEEEGEAVWSLACMYIRRALRRQGAAHQMIEAAVAHARGRGASAVEAYPVDPDSPSYRFMGFVAAFAAAGFSEVGRAGSRRHVMRLTLPRDGQLKR
jgi:GNAT superfamily N-acetyltransferase